MKLISLIILVSLFSFATFKSVSAIFIEHHIEEEQEDEDETLGRIDIIDHEEMTKIAKNVFGFAINSEIDEEPIFPLNGVVYGHKHRVIFPMIIQHEEIPIKTMVLFDTRTLYSLGIMGKKKLNEGMHNMNMFVHGEWVSVSASRNEQFQEINLYLFEGKDKLVLTVSGGSKTAQLSIDPYVAVLKKPIKKWLHFDRMNCLMSLVVCNVQFVTM